ncbi:Tigger transposable element-derived protein 6 [Thelohanellus kitauei]|uniref:Tigger transposable element-derived protein 6 n=1 Tax=Thelohanellus kitauei TaxID=669202 RepID=A0A0C2IYS3_THEKT|nr:Tigger transposable element-derived protein 6 [Thelohanellus kitauei]
MSKTSIQLMDSWNDGRRGNNIKSKKLHGEKQDAYYLGAESRISDALLAIIKDCEAKDIFSADETGLYWRAIPERTLAFKNSETAGGKMAKERTTLLLACNMDGSEKLKPLTVGKSKNPQCFKNVKTLPVDYEACKKCVDDNGHLDGLAEEGGHSNASQKSAYRYTV